MAKAERSLTELGQHVASLQDEARRGLRDRERGLERFIAADLDAARRPGASKPASRRLSPWIWSSAAAALLFVLIAALVPIQKPIAFDLGDGDDLRRGVVGAWIAAPRSSELPLHFSDGSLVLLGAGGRARVAAADRDGAEIALENGALDLAIVHRTGTRWQVQAGPFLIHVIGTRFSTTWDPAKETFSVLLREGAITVDGPVVGQGRAVRAGERIEVSTIAGTLTVGDASTNGADRESTAAHRDAPNPTAPLPSTSSTDDDAAVAEPPTAALPAIGSARREPSSWREIAAKLKYKDALAAAEIEGFEAICAGASATDLHALADAARLGGNGARADQAFTALLARFPGSEDASYAAFMRGRTAAERHDYSGAATWLSRYLRERPDGRFAEEASGRLVEVSDKMGDVTGARRAAERYLASYPNGSHAEFARRVVARASP